MAQILPPKLDFDAVQQLTAHPPTRPIPTAFKPGSYATEMLGSIVLTEDGLQRLAVGSGRTGEPATQRLQDTDNRRRELEGGGRGFPVDVAVSTKTRG